MSPDYSTHFVSEIRARDKKIIAEKYAYGIEYLYQLASFFTLINTYNDFVRVWNTAIGGQLVGSTATLGDNEPQVPIEPRDYQEIYDKFGVGFTVYGIYDYYTKELFAKEYDQANKAATQTLANQQPSIQGALPEELFGRYFMRYNLPMLPIFLPNYRYHVKSPAPTNHYNIPPTVFLIQPGGGGGLGPTYPLTPPSSGVPRSRAQYGDTPPSYRNFMPRPSM